MAHSAKGPTAPISEKSGAQDVKETPASSTEEAAAKQDTPENEAKATDPDVEEDDLKALEEEKKIPYGRFKEKVDEAKTLKDQVARLQRQHEEEKRRAIEETELRVAQRLRQKQEDAEDLDDTTREFRKTHSEIATLKAELAGMQREANHRKLQGEIDTLKTKYPEADAIAVLGWKKVQEQADIEELMALSHNQNIERVEKKFRTLIEHKRAKAKQVTPSKEAGIRLKESEKPKSLADAKALMKKYFGAG